MEKKHGAEPYCNLRKFPLIIMVAMGFLLLNPVSLLAQGKIISGKVTTVEGLPLNGVSISIKGGSRGTSTNQNGFFEIASSKETVVLIFTSVGYKVKEVPARAGQPVNVTLEKDVSSLSDVVVVGYGTQKKVNLTGSVSSISSESLVSRPVGQASAALQGLAPGITVTQSSGRPGGDAGTIRIRGIGTLNDPNPLVLIDGVEGSIDNIDPNLIESISVLKDAASASIYGSRAANGVILVTTKRAKGGKLSVAYNTYVGWQSPTNLPKMVNAVDHMILTNEAYTNTGRSPLYSAAFIEKYRTDGPGNRDQYPDTDWQKELLTGSGLMQSHFISLNGGGEKIRFLTSLGYLSQDGIIESSGFKRFTIRNNADVKFSNKLSLRFDLQLVADVTKEPGPGSKSVFHWMNRIPANQAGQFADGSWGEGWNGVNPIAFTHEGGLQKRKNPSAQINLSLNYKPVDWLQAEFTVAPRYAEYTDDDFNKAIQTYNYDGTPLFVAPAVSSLKRVSSESFYNNLRATLTFMKKVGDHNVKVLAGASREDFRNDNFSAYREGFILPDYPVLNTGSSGTQQNTGTASEWALQSFFGRINYDFESKYLLEVNGRYDGSSRFSAGNKYGFFPSVSAGWRISEEGFMESAKPVINELKLRGSWGQLGNQNIGNYPFTSSIVTGSYTFGNQVTNIAALNTLANTDISWETTEMTNFGVDVTVLRNLSITADYFVRKTRDILYKLDIPLIIGLAAPDQNVGVVENKGWELGVIYRGAVNDFKYNINLNVSDVKNKVLDLRGVNRTGLTTSIEGYPINSIYGLQADGFFQTDAEAAAHAKQFGTTAAGDIRYVDQNKDGIINDADNVIIGSTIPRYTYGANLNLEYKGFNLNMFFQGVGKADGYLYQQGIMPFFNGGTVQEQHKDRWTPDNKDATFPRFAFSQTNNEQNSSFWLKDASYLRLKNLQLGYSLPARISQRAGLTSVRIYANATNVFTIDKFWKGYDVEAPVGRGDEYPQVKVFTLGLDVNF